MSKAMQALAVNIVALEKSLHEMLKSMWKLISDSALKLEISRAFTLPPKPISLCYQ